MLDYCGGCKYHSFPYKAESPVRVDGKTQVLEFVCKDDIWEVIDAIKKESEDLKSKGYNIDITKNIASQIAFFACPEMLKDPKYIEMINKYIYCKETNVPPYPGSYGEQPFRWVKRFFAIKSALNKKEQIEMKKQRAKAKAK